MRKIVILFCIFTLFLSCTKYKKMEAYTIRYTVGGNGIEEIICNINNANYNVKGDITNGWDTTVSFPTKQKLHIIAKSKGGSLPHLLGVMYLNNYVVNRNKDTSRDNNGRFEINIEYNAE